MKLTDEAIQDLFAHLCRMAAERELPLEQFIDFVMDSVPQLGEWYARTFGEPDNVFAKVMPMREELRAALHERAKRWKLDRSQ